jgi:tetratricopeptide (TPR) repeat protein
MISIKSNGRVLEFADRAMENWRLLGSDFADAKNLVQILYRATAKTFQSPRVMRHLIYALEGAGNYVDAERSIDAYIFIVENEKKTVTKSRKETRNLDDVEVLPDIDSDDDILRTISAGIRIIVKYLNHGQKAMDLAQKLDKNVNEWDVTSPEVQADVYQAIGLANSLWSTQSILVEVHTNVAIDPDSRINIQLTAVTAYTTALSHAPNRLEIYYQLALQYARQRNLEKAISALSQALHLKKTHIPSIHLLTLLLTSLEDYEKALQTCHTIKFDHIDDLPLDDAVALMELQLTYLRIVETVSGRELALEVQKGVFMLYNRLFGPVKANQGYVKTEAEVDWDQKAVMSDQNLRRTKSNIPERRHLYKSSLAEKESIESRQSLQVPSNRAGRTRSLLRRKQRSRSVDGSLQTRSSEDFNEKPQESGILLPFRADH